MCHASARTGRPVAGPRRSLAEPRMGQRPYPGEGAGIIGRAVTKATTPRGRGMSLACPAWAKSYGVGGRTLLPCWGPLDRTRPPDTGLERPLPIRSSGRHESMRTMKQLALTLLLSPLPLAYAAPAPAALQEEDK